MAPSMTTAFPTHSDLGAMVQRQQRPLKDPYAAAAVPSTGLSRRKVAPCLRKISAYNGGSLIPEDAEDYSTTDKGRYTLKKKLSFADQHGQELALQHEFSRWDAPILCNVKLLPEVHTVAPASRPVEDVPSLERLLVVACEKRSRWSQQEVLSLCVVSCAVVGCALIGIRHAAQ